LNAQRSNSQAESPYYSFILYFLYTPSSATTKFSIPSAMHNTLAILYSIFFITSTTALFLPQFRYTPQIPSNPALANKCTFTLWHKQLHTPTTKTNYIQLNELRDHTNGITIDVAALRHVMPRNSYALISEKLVFAIEGLPDNTNLTVRGEDGSDVVRCEHDGVRFSSDERGSGKDAWCGFKGMLFK
jgi:hypothetical protein